MDFIGEKIFTTIDKVKERKEQKEDREIGEKARIVRREVVTDLEEKVKKVTPKIMPKAIASVSDDSGRKEREKQANLFDSMHSQHCRC